MHSDLIFVSKLVLKEAYVNFTKKDAGVIILDNHPIMLVIWFEWLYVIDVLEFFLSKLIVQSKQKTMSFNIWYKRLVHIES